jgi:hypothetical protein
VKLGTKSVLFGAHAFFLHPWFVALGWWKLYGFPWDPRLWFAFFVHDLGYIGMPNMDGEEGEQHPVFGALIMGFLFDRGARVTQGYASLGKWGELTLCHSRYFAKRFGLRPSRLCMADKLAIALTPAWLYLPMVNATGEIREYMDLAHRRAKSGEKLSTEERRESTSGNQRRWYAAVQAYAIRYVDEHRDGKDDTWTAANAQGAADANAGVWG